MPVRSGRYKPGARKGQVDFRLRSAASRELFAKNAALLQQTRAQAERTKVLEADVARLTAVVDKLLEQRTALQDRNKDLELELKREINHRLAAEADEDQRPHVRRAVNRLLA